MWRHRWRQDRLHTRRRHGYDIRRIWLDGTPEDRAVFTLSHPDVVEHDARLTAYEEQVCTA
ncbi:MAG TPA: hypothetical protein VHH57_03280 [Gaiella sp.]|nr:hypothetical protein [Gaiella sp.]